jgi:glycosyltransferase involved in cell wall biosynthesis
VTSKIVMGIGRVSPDKRPQDAIRIIRIVREAVHDAELFWIGGGQLLHFQSLHDNEPYINFLGDVSNKWEWLGKSSVYISTSSREGFNLTIGEALLAGVPTIAYDLPVYKYVYESGLVCVPRFDVNAFAITVIDVLLHPEKYGQIVEAGRRFVVQKYTSEVVAKRIEEALIRILD